MYHEIKVNILQVFVRNADFMPCRGFSIISRLKKVPDIRGVHQHFNNHLNQSGDMYGCNWTFLPSLPALSLRILKAEVTRSTLLPGSQALVAISTSF